jgi:ABC-type sugar transport system substrate-binding protein
MRYTKRVVISVITCGLTLAASVGPTGLLASAGAASKKAPPKNATSVMVARILKLEKSWMVPIKLNYNPGPLSGSVKGKVIVEVLAGSASGLSEAADIQSIGSTLGLTVTQINPAATAEGVVNAFQQAATTPNVAGVIDIGYDPSVWQTTYDSLISSHIPVVMVAADCGPWDQTGINVWSGCGATKSESQAAAEWIYANAKGKPNTVVVNVPQLLITAGVTVSFRNEYKKLCAKCSLGQLDMANFPGDIGTALPGQIASYLEAHPKVKYVFTDFGDMLIGVSGAVKAAGISGVKFVSEDTDVGDVANLEGGSEAANFSNPHQEIDYVAVDAISRAILGQSTAAASKWIFPFELVTPASVKKLVSSGQLDATSGHYNVPLLQGFFTNLWHS